MSAEPELCDPAFAWVRNGPDYQREWRGVDFLAAENPDLHAAYRKWWPRTGNVPNWDAVGRREVDGASEWLLVEAKAHLRELDQCCSAKDQAGGGAKQHIARLLGETKAALSQGNPNDWLAHYYQYANRLATLRFLLDGGARARLLHIYFVGDADFADAAQSREEWLAGSGRLAGLQRMHEWFGRPFAPEVEGRLHEVFLPVLQPHSRPGAARG